MQNMTEEISTPETEGAVAETQTSAPETETKPTETTTPETKTPDNKIGGLIYPDGSDKEAVLKFRQACGYPEKAEGYGLPMDTDEQKNIAAFLHSCQLDSIAAKTVAEKLTEKMAQDDKAEKELHANEVKKVQESWGEQMKANTDLVNRGAEILQIDKDGLRGMAEAIGTETALTLLMIAGKLTSDHSDVNGTNGSNAEEDLNGYIRRKRLQG